MVRYLVDKGASVNVQDRLKNTGLYYTILYKLWHYYNLTDQQCPQIKALLPRKKSTIRVTAKNNSKAGLTTKINTICEAKGRPLAFYLTAGQCHDLQGADKLLNNIKAPAFLADKAYDAGNSVLDKSVKKLPSSNTAKVKSQRNSYL